MYKRKFVPWHRGWYDPSWYDKFDMDTILKTS